MIIIDDCSLTPNPANINSAVSVKVGVTEFPSVLSQASWAQIAQASELGLASSLWSVGDEKTIYLAPEDGGLPEKPDDYNTVTLAIMGFNHDDKADGTGKAGITFGAKNLAGYTRGMNNSNTNSGGFTGSNTYRYLQNTLFSQFATDLQSAIKPILKKTSAGSKNTTINTNEMKIFLFSEIEVFGSITYSFSGEGSQYNYFATEANRVKYLYNGAGNAYTWWLRSPHASSSTAFCTVSSTGGENHRLASRVTGVCFGFCV